jgi:GNAT superfamily N-acetyltransferase
LTLNDRSCYLLAEEAGQDEMVEIEASRNGRPGLAALQAEDEELVGRMFGRLSPESVYRRFFSPVASAEHFTRLVLRADAHERMAIAAVEGGELVAVAQYSRRPGADEADLAILVADEWQRQGLGTRLVAALADRARGRGIARFTVDVQGDNFGIHRLLRRVAPQMRLTFSGGAGEGAFSIEAR